MMSGPRSSFVWGACEFLRNYSHEVQRGSGEEECFTPLCAALSRTSAKSAGSLQGRKAALEDAAAMAMRCAEFARRVLKTAGNGGLQVAARSQRRGMAKGIGNLPVKENSYVESWAKRREHVEDDFRYALPFSTRRRLPPRFDPNSPIAFLGPNTPTSSFVRPPPFALLPQMGRQDDGDPRRLRRRCTRLLLQDDRPRIRESHHANRADRSLTLG